MEAVELAEHGVLGGGVDDQRLVAAPAGLAGLDHALLAGGVLGENLPQTLHGTPAGAEPIEGEQFPARIGGGGHATHTREGAARALPQCAGSTTVGRSVRLTHRKGPQMSYLLTHFWPGGTEAEYRATVAAATDAAGGTLPESFHAAGPTDGGFLIAATYESKEVCDRFVQDTLLPLMPIEGGLVGPPEERGAEIVTAS